MKKKTSTKGTIQLTGKITGENHPFIKDFLFVKQFEELDANGEYIFAFMDYKDKFPQRAFVEKISHVAKRAGAKMGAGMVLSSISCTSRP